jgi:hypothetical protein
MKALSPSPKMSLFRGEDGQSVSEYSLLLAFVFLVSLCLFVTNARNITSIWEIANGLISHAQSAGQSAKP